MRKHLITSFVAVGLLATLNSCSKEEQAIIKTSVISADPLDPGNYGYYDLGEGELYHYRDSLTTYGQVGKNYLTMKPLSLEKYKNGQLLDSVCNEDLTLYFENKVIKTHDKTALWATKPEVVDEHPPIVTIKTGITTKIKLSKMATAFGFEYNSLYKGYEYGVTVTYWNTQLNLSLPTSATRYLDNDTRFGPVFGSPGGAKMDGVKANMPFDEIRITFETGYGAPILYPPFDISLAGFRYILAE